MEKSKLTETKKHETGDYSQKKSSWQAKHSITHINVTFYGDSIKMCKDFAPNFGEKRTGCWITTLPLSPGFFFYQKQHDRRPPPHPTRLTWQPSTFLSFPD
jgi:hypothetical protein